MFRKYTLQALFALLTVIAMVPGRAVAQQPMPSGVVLIENQLERLRQDKERFERSLRMLREGNDFGVLVGGYTRDGKFVPFTEVPGEEFALPVYLPMAPERLIETLTIRMLAGEVTPEQARHAVENLRAGARAKLSQRVRDGLADAEREYRGCLAGLNAEIAALTAARNRLLAGAANPPVQDGFVRIGTGLLKDERFVGKPPVGLFEIKRDGARTQLILTFGPDLKQIGTQDSLDEANQTATYKFEVAIRDNPKATRLRGRAKVDFRNNSVRSSFEEFFDPKTSAWKPAETVVEAQHTQAWGETIPADRKVLSQRGQLVPAQGKNEAQASFNVTVRPGAVYTFELKAPDKNRIVLHVDDKDQPIVSKFTQKSGKTARVIERLFGEAQTYRVRIAGFGSDLPANYELEVWEYWPFNGNVPPQKWAE